ncbi:hypothetical protein HD553DRAFT_305852 [Filobasidium floriforme]|uniref:uncharacterized protein n=1 Tax=Filobasidium floriforme TaxID=5210 RepID=UPI001E8D14BD|nr:uncharacterized protein HD553DRAFT_305852 [Filobasidium floriforme]KAH8089336.1 hypothetical protein HD553DRAFT_305852 [Filobasidium floriforme]
MSRVVPRHENITNEHIRVTFSDSTDEEPVIQVVHREAFMLSPVLRENLPPPSPNITQPTEIALPESTREHPGIRLLLEILDDLAGHFDAGAVLEELLLVTEPGIIESALVMADKYAVTTLFKQYCHLWCCRLERSELDRVLVALCLWDPVIARNVMGSCKGNDTSHPGTWPSDYINFIGFRHWQTLVRIVVDHCISQPTAGYHCIYWPSVAEHFPWDQPEYWSEGPNRRDVLYGP